MTDRPRFDWRAYGLQMLIGFALYITALFGSITILRHNHYAGDLALPIALLPMVPGLFITYVILKFYARLDELQRRIQSEAFIAAALITGLGVATLSFAENAGVPPVNNQWFFPAMIALWGIFGALFRLRYR